MQITLVSPFDPQPARADGCGAHVGGVERVYAEVSRRLARRGHDVTVVCSTDGPPGRAVEGGVHVVRAHRRLTVLRAPLARLARLLDGESGLVQVAATYPFTTPRVLRRANSLGLPALLDFHFEPAPGTVLGRAAAGMYRRVGPRAYRFADAVLVRSLAYARAARSLRRVPEGRWRVVPNGIDTERFRPAGPTAEGGYLLFVGRLVPYKGLDVLLRTLGALRSAPPLVVVGDGPMRKRLEALARRHAVYARFLGHVPDDELAPLYRGATCTVLPSVTRQEAFGMALLESMACGTPVVASGLPGVEELASLGGLVARPGDPASLAQQIQRAFEPNGLPRGASLARRIHAAFSWDAVTERLLEIYEEVGGPAAARPPAASGTEVTLRAHPGRDAVL